MQQDFVLHTVYRKNMFSLDQHHSVLNQLDEKILCDAERNVLLLEAFYGQRVLKVQIVTIGECLYYSRA